jgi:hypothetical protein
VWNKTPGAKGDHVHMPVLPVILGNQFGQDFAAPVPCIRPVNTGRGNEDNLVDAVGSGGFEYLEGAAHIQVKEIVGIFVAAIFVDAVPGGDVDDAIAAAQCLCQLRPVQNGPLDKQRSLFQIPWSAKVENDRCVALGKQPGHKGLAEISGPSGQHHLHSLLPQSTRVSLGNTQAGRTVRRHRIEDLAHRNLDRTRRNGMARRNPPRKVTYFEPVPPRLARNTIIESTFDVGRRFRCTMRVDCGELDPGAVIRPVPGEWHPRMPAQLDEEELADWRAGRNAVYQLAALTIGARLTVADA